MTWHGVTRASRLRTGRSVAMVGATVCKFVRYLLADDGPDNSIINWIADPALPFDRLPNRADWTRKGWIEDVLPSLDGLRVRLARRTGADPWGGGGV
jgi:hypothetical protein